MRAAADCPDCRGTGWRTLTVGETRRAERCDCWRTGVAQQMLARARIPARYSKCDFSTFITYENEKLQRACRKAQEFAAAFPVVDKGLLFIGPPGIGKTHVAVSVLREVVLKGMRGVYYDTRSLLSTIRSTYNPVTRASEAEVLDEVMRAELLVLDDLGAERLTDWVEETMHLIVNTRYNEKRPTVFTTNYEDVSDVGDLDSLLVRVGYRLHSRLREMCEFLEYDGPDYREFEHPPTAEFLYQKWKMGPGRPAPPAARLPQRASGRARARLPEGQLDLGWVGGKAGT
jgi:DNA replication protein DnaC